MSTWQITIGGTGLSHHGFCRCIRDRSERTRRRRVILPAVPPAGDRVADAWAESAAYPPIAAITDGRLRWQPWPSRPGEFHPEPLTDPDLNPSIHPARVTPRRLPPSAEPSGSSRFYPVGPPSTTMTHPLPSLPIPPLRPYYQPVLP